MIRSMTGYGAGEASNSKRAYKVEIRAVNHKYNDIQIKLPRGFLGLEDKVKSIVTAKIKRGKVDVYVSYTDISVDANEIKPDIPLAKAYYSALSNLSDALNLQNGYSDISLSLLTKFPDVIKMEESENDLDVQWETLGKAVSAAVDMLCEMSVREGKYLVDVIKTGVDGIKETLSEIKERAPHVIEENYEKLRLRVQKLLNGVTVDEQRLMQEIAIIADKCDINEETARLESHIAQFHIIVSEKELIGKKLDFLIQEMNRETNTIGSKANDIEITKRVIFIKNEIEKIREQVQNIE